MNVDPKSYNQWLTYKLVQRDGGGLGKAPCCPTHRHLVSGNDPVNWLSFDQVRNQKIDGIGLWLTANTPFAVVDIDGNTDHPLVATLATYTEYSPSGNGLHLWLAIEDKSAFTPTTIPDIDEVIVNGFITVTGKRMIGTPQAIRVVTAEQLTSLLGVAPMPVAPMPVAPMPSPPTIISRTPDPTYRKPYRQFIAELDDSALWKLIFQKDSTGNVRQWAFGSYSPTRSTKVERGSRRRVTVDHNSTVYKLACTLARWTFGDAERVARMLQQTTLAGSGEAEAWGERWDRSGETFIDHVVGEAIPRVGGAA